MFRPPDLLVDVGPALICLVGNCLLVGFYSPLLVVVKVVIVIVVVEVVIVIVAVAVEVVVMMMVVIMMVAEIRQL